MSNTTDHDAKSQIVGIVNTNRSNLFIDAPVEFALAGAAFSKGD
jgi:hypothetical protein